MSAAPPLSQTAQHVLLVRPAAFGFNPDTAGSNALQRADASPGQPPALRALAEFDALRRALESEGIGVVVCADTPEPRKPDAVFPNNWVSFHADGSVVLYPMLAPNRRLERRREVIESATQASGFAIRRWVDLSGAEADGRFLEGTGSLVLDHVARIAYACRSPRTDPSLVELWCAEFGYAPVLFDATDADGRPYYHTNVMLSIGSAFAVVAAESIAPPDRERVLGELADSGRELVTIDRRAVAGFAGNVLELASWDEALGDLRVLVMSAAARAALGETDYARLRACVDSTLVIPVPCIEAAGGGSVRCMIAEIFTT
ncbi:MAG: arginine deiminase-related protein [Steroidobacteraceae bacterium]